MNEENKKAERQNELSVALPEEAGASNEVAACGQYDEIVTAEQVRDDEEIEYIDAPEEITEGPEAVKPVDEVAAEDRGVEVAAAEQDITGEEIEEKAVAGNGAAADKQSLEVVAAEQVLTGDESEFVEELESLESGEADAQFEAAADSDESPVQSDEEITATREEIKPAIESLLFVAEEPLSFKSLCKILGDVSEDDVRAALEGLVADYETRNSGLEIREIGGGWRISTRPQNHDFIRKYLKSRPSARLSLPALETLAVIAYKQPITVPEILEIRGVTSSSAIKTLLERRLIVTKGRKETVGRPMLYGTSKEFLIQFGLKDLTELPSIEDFEDLAQ